MPPVRSSFEPPPVGPILPAEQRREDNRMGIIGLIVVIILVILLLRLL